MVYPRAMSAYALPWEIPLISCCRNVSKGRRLRRDGLDVLELTIHDAQHDRGLHGVALRVDGDPARDSRKVFGLSERVTHGFRVRGAGALHCIEEDVRGVEGESGERIGRLSVTLRVRLDEVLNDRTRVLRRIVIREVRVV